MNTGPQRHISSHLLTFLDRTRDYVGIVDDRGAVTYLNDAARKRLGFGATEGLVNVDVFPPEVFARYYDEIRPVLVRDGHWAGQLDVVSAAGERFTLDVSIVGLVAPGAEVTGLVMYGRDVAAAAPSNYAFVHDDLTGLPRRAILEDHIRLALARSTRDQTRVAVVVADVDGMKDVNDAYGHAVGDEVLLMLARVMTRAVRSADTVARIGGDEFVLLLDGITETDDALHLIERVRESVMRTPVDASTGPISVTASFGVAMGDGGDSADELIQRADAAMYRAKTAGGGRVIAFDAGAELSISTLADEFAVAVSHGLIRPHVHPVVDLQTGAVVGYQGLARWMHHHRGMLTASQFIDTVANTPVAPVVDLAVLRRTAAAAARAARRGTPIRAYGHISRRLLGDADVERYLVEIADDLALPMSELHVEVAHSYVTRHSRVLQTTLRSLREAGMRIVLSAVDGECDPNDIVAYGFDELRLSPALVRDAVDNLDRRRVAQGTVALAHAVGVPVIAVGIETGAGHRAMLDAGCEYGEGYLFGDVVPAGEIE